MKDRLSDTQAEAILKALNDALEDGSWEKSNFLKIIGKNITEIRDDFLRQQGTHSDQLKAEASAKRVTLKSGQQEVFVALYCTDGSNLQSWERIVSNLPRQMISRPIYANEEDIKASIKSKDNKLNEAYVAIYINQTDILSLSAEKTATDKLGKTLLSLKDKSLNLENINKFIHLSGIYQFINGRLIKS